MVPPRAPSFNRSLVRGVPGLRRAKPGFAYGRALEAGRFRQ